MDFRQAYDSTYLLHGAEFLLRSQLVLQLIKEFPAFYGTRRFITILTSARHPSLSWAYDSINKNKLFELWFKSGQTQRTNCLLYLTRYKLLPINWHNGMMVPKLLELMNYFRIPSKLVKLVSATMEGAKHVLR